MLTAPVARNELGRDAPTYRDMARQALAYRDALEACTASLDYIRELNQSETTP